MTKQLYRQEGCNPYRIAILPWVQLPLWLLMSFTLRDMAGLYSDHLLPSADIRVSLALEGCLWFQDLTLPDPYLVLPIVMAATNLCNIEVISSSSYRLQYELLIYYIEHLLKYGVCFNKDCKVPSYVIYNGTPYKGHYLFNENTSCKVWS